MASCCQSVVPDSTLQRSFLPPQEGGCCSANASDSEWLKAVDTVCRLAIGIFAAISAPNSFALFSGLGVVTGGIYAAVKLYRQEDLFPQGKNKPVCAQGYMDFLSGMGFPPPVGTLATAAFIVAHVRHDPQFYVPFCGFFIGLWAGRETVNFGMGQFATLVK